MIARTETKAAAPSFRHRLEALALKGAIAVFRLVPVDVASAAMGWLWRVFAPLNPRHKRALKHLEAAYPEMSLEDRKAILNQMWDNLGRVAAETFFIRDLLKDPSRFELNVDETTQSVLDGKAHAVFISLHSGNWELSVQPLFAHGQKVAGVYQALKNPLADKVLRGMREDLYQHGLLPKGYETARKLMSLVKNGDLVAIMADLKEHRGASVDFFGREASATPIPATLARSSEVPLIAGRVVRTKGARFRIEAKAIPPVVTTDRKADIQVMTQQAHDLFESWIREEPGQWMWIIRKWR